jgi:hypothetical protein
MSGELTINYGGTNYLVTLTSDPSSFRVISPAGAVDSNTAAHLFGAEQAYSTLVKLYTVAGVTQTPTYWDNVVQSDATILGWVGASNALSSFSGLLLGGLLTDGTTLAAQATQAFASATKSLAPSMVDIAVTAAAVQDANNLLSQATSEFDSIQTAANQGQAISYDNIENAINNTLISLYTGDAASQAASNIPGVQGNLLDDIIGFIGNAFSTFTGAVTEVGGVFNQVQSDLIGSASGTADLIDKLGDTKDQLDFIDSLSAILTADTARFTPLTAAGLAQSAVSLQGNPSVSSSSHASVFSINPTSPTFNENAGTVTFTISRTDTSQGATVYASTVQDQGITNPNNDFYYNGILNQVVAFASGAATAQVHLNINDLGLTSGAEAFRLIVQQNSGDPITTSLASDTFIISNTDQPPASSYSISPNVASVNESAGTQTFTITRTNTSQAATVYVSTVHDQGFGNPNGNYYYDGLLNLPVTFAAGQATAQVKLSINDLGLSSGSETFRLIAQEHSSDPVSTALASANFTIANNDAGIVADATVNEAVNTTFLLQPFLSLPANGKTVSDVNFINTGSGPGELTFDGNPTSSNIAVGYADVGEVGFATGSITGSDKIEMYATYSDGTKSNVVDLTVNIQSSALPPAPPLNSSGPIVSTNVQALQLTVGQNDAFSSANLDATDAAYPDPSEITYTVTSDPVDGEILVGGQFARSFTQADIDAGRVFYQSAAQANLTNQITDTFTYVVSDPSFNQTRATAASVNIEPLPPPPQTEEPYVDIDYFPVVPEGGQIFVLGNRFSVQDLHVTDPNPNFPPIYQTGSAIDQAITYTVVTPPAHGQLIWFTNANQDATHQYGQPVTTFSQSDLNNGWIVYKNSFTSGASDGFTFTVSDGFGGTIGPTTATIPVQPVDPVVLDINAGVFVTTGGQSVISPDWLRVDDAAPNAYPSGFPTYSVVQAPSHGTLLVSGQVATTFTQLDIDRDLVTYEQNGTASGSDQFTLAVVNDAYGNTIPDLIVPVTIANSAVDRNTGAVVGVGESTVIDDANLDAADPGMGSGNQDADPPSALKYTITALSAHGSLSVDGTTLQLGGSFTQADLDSGSLTYTENGSIAASDSFGFSLSDIFVHNNYGSGTFDISIVNANGGRIFTGGLNADIFYSGPGNNWVAGGTDTTVSYSLAPTGVNIDLPLGVASNGFGGTDTLSNVHSVIGSAQDDTFIAESNASDTFVGNGGSDTVVFSGAMANYSIASNNTGLVVSNGSITDTLTGITNLRFADGVSSYDAQGNLVAQTIDNASGSSWVDTYDPENTSNLLWSTNSYDANGNLLSQTTTNDDGTHSLTMYDVNNSYNWSSATINFDAQWNETSVSGTNDDGSHTTAPKGLASAYDTALWFATPFDANWKSTTPVTLTGDTKNDFLVGNAGNDMLVAGTGNDILYGNGGSNTFAFGPGSGQDKIMDFQTDQDVIQFNPALFANYAAVMQDTSQVGANTVIQHDANTSITLANTLASSLTASNFHFS